MWWGGVGWGGEERGEKGRRREWVMELAVV
jgi:hypothetical protein